MTIETDKAANIQTAKDRIEAGESIDDVATWLAVQCPDHFTALTG